MQQPSDAESFSQTRPVPLLAIVGPSGSGKTALALRLAHQFRGEIVNCDSLQLYRGLDIGTAKLPVSERQSIPHHLFDVLELTESYSAGDYSRDARKVIADIAVRLQLPIVVGGTGFYLKALLEGLPRLPERDAQLRARLLERETKFPGRLHRILKRLDSRSAELIHERDVQKLIRAVEVRLTTGHSRSHAAEAHPFAQFSPLKLGLDPPREQLHQRLAQRTQAMFDQGLVEEVRALLGNGVGGGEKPFESLGYRQALQYLRGEMTLTQAISSTLIGTRQYAKRQWTWFRRDPEVIWMKGFGDAADVNAQASAAVEQFLSCA